MSHSAPPNPESPEPSRPFSVDLLERGDGIVHVVVAFLLLALSVAILVGSTCNFVGQLLRPMPPDAFVPAALSYLSNVLFGVIVLELLSTILTYIRARSLEATIKDFLVVGLISSVRKILLIGAQSSAQRPNGAEDFVKESFGTVISVVGILLLICGLLLLDRRSKANKAPFEPMSP